MEYKIATQQQQHFLETFDIFGIGINIRFNKKAVHKTKIGGFITLLIIAILSYQIKLILENLYDSQNPFVLFEQRYTSSPERQYLTSDKFIMTFGLQDSKSQHYIDPTVYNATLLIKQTDKTLDPTTNQFLVNKQQRQVKIEPCRIDHFNIPQVNHYFTSLAYKNMYCISKEETGLFLEGQFDALHYSTFELLIETCTGPNCNPNMNQILSLCRLAVYYVDYSVIPSNKDNPFQPLGRQSFWVSGPAFTKISSISFRNTYLKSDYNMIGSKEVVDKSLTFILDRELVAPRSSNVLFDCFIQFDKNFDSVYKRSYQKLDKSISQLGGIFNILFTLGAILCRPLSQIELNLKLINRLFYFENNEDDSSKNPDSKQDNRNNLQKSNSTFREDNQKEKVDRLFPAEKSQNQEIFRQQFNKKLTNQGQQQSTIQQAEGEELTSSRYKNQTSSGITTILKKSASKERSNRQQQHKQNLQEQQGNNQKQKQTNDMKKFFKFQENNIFLQKWEYFINLFRISSICKNRKYNLIEKGIDKLYNQIDIFYVIQKMLEVEKLKHLLLNENQIKLFEFIPRPVLRLENANQSNSSDKIGIFSENEKDFTQKANDAQQAFTQIVTSRQKPSKVDLRILELLDPQFKKLQYEQDEVKIDCSPQQRSVFLKFDQQNFNYDPDDMLIATEEYNNKCYTSDLTYSPRKTLQGLYTSSTKPNQTNQINANMSFMN